MNLVTLAQESVAQNGFYVPQFEIRIAGVGLPRDVLRDVTQVTYSDNIKEIDGFEVSVNNWDPEARRFKYIGSETVGDLKSPSADGLRYRLFDPCNKQVDVRMGYSGDLRRMVLGTFTTLEPNFPSGGPPTLTVRGLNVLHQLRRKQYSKEWSIDDTHGAGWRDSDIAKDIAQLVDKDLGKDKKRFPIPIVALPTRGDTGMPYVSQNNQYDIDFLLTRARRRGYVVYVREGDPKSTVDAEKVTHLYFGPSDAKVPGFRDVVFKLTWGASLIDFKPTLTTANQVKSVTVKGWDRNKKQGFEGKATLQDPELALNPVLHELLNTCDPREEVVVTKPVRTEQQAKALALAILRDRFKDMLKASVTCIGLPDLRAGMKVDIGGVGARFSGTYFITDTTHTFSADSGYTTKFNARREVAGLTENLE